MINGFPPPPSSPAQVKKAGGKGWSDFQAFWAGPEDTAETGTEPESQQHNGEDGEKEEREDEQVGDLLGSFSEDTTPSKAHQPAAKSKGFKSYGSTGYGSTGFSSREKQGERGKEGDGARDRRLRGVVFPLQSPSPRQ